MGHPGQKARVAEKPDQAQVIQARPEATAGEGEADLVHGRVHVNSSPQTTGAISRRPAHDRTANWPLLSDSVSTMAAIVPSRSTCSAVVVANRCMPRATIPVQPV